MNRLCLALICTFGLGACCSCKAGAPAKTTPTENAAPQGQVKVGQADAVETPAGWVNLEQEINALASRVGSERHP